MLFPLCSLLFNAMQFRRDNTRTWQNEKEGYVLHKSAKIIKIPITGMRYRFHLKSNIYMTSTQTRRLSSQNQLISAMQLPR
jgi:hypothetical protein